MKWIIFIIIYLIIVKLFVDTLAYCSRCDYSNRETQELYESESDDTDNF